MKNMHRKKILIGFISCLTVVLFCKIAYRDKKTKEWLNDIDYIQTTVTTTHPFISTNEESKEKFIISINKLEKEISNLKDYEIELRLQEILATFRDAHTVMDTPNLSSKRYPLNFKWFKNKLIVVGADKTLKSILGKELISINDIPLKDILNKINKLPSYENEQNLKYINSSMITWYYVLNHYKITSSEKAKFTFKNSSNKEDIIIKPVENLSYENLNKLKDLSHNKPVRSQYKQTIDNSKYWYKYVKNDRILYFQYNECDQSIKSINKEIRNEFGEFSAKLCNSLSNENFDKLIIDLRYNRGGIATVLEDIYIDLKPELSQVKTFIFVGPSTFSASIVNAVHLKAWYPNQVIVLGEKPGQPLKFYSTQFFTLPNSNINSVWSNHP